MEQEEMEAEMPEKNERETPLSDSDWENRKLCSDGSCIGVIGADGHCRECGKKYSGSITEESSFENEDLPPQEEASDEIAEPDKKNEAPTNVDWENRKLCSDGNCIGVIGPEGRCKECGKSFE